MQEALFEQYEAAKARGDKRLASSLVARFVATFATDEERGAWTRRYLDSSLIHHTIRYELFEHVIFPVLLAGYQKSDPWCLAMLDRHAQNLYRAKHLWAKVGDEGDVQFAQRWLELEPENAQARGRVLEHWMTWFGYCEHEWPAGILYGMNGATESECGEILDKVCEIRALDRDGVHRDYLDQFEAKVLQYRKRLSYAAAAGTRSM